MNIIYKASRVYNRIVLNAALFLINKVWDYTKRNKDIKEDSLETTKWLLTIIG